ncbi:hypothetical protein QL285_027048 [Trifolium repens]|nr:hypothetical protein QL285_027048 [Trifolium repens]
MSCLELDHLNYLKVKVKDLVASFFDKSKKQSYFVLARMFYHFHEYAVMTKKKRFPNSLRSTLQTQVPHQGPTPVAPPQGSTPVAPHLGPTPIAPH